MTEIWLPITDYEGSYEVSSLGRIRSLDRIVPCGPGRKGRKLASGQEISPFMSNQGYRRVVLWKDRESKKFMVHFLVAQEFLGPRPPGLQVCHNDGDKLNNASANLRWDTASSNIRDCVLHGTQVQARKTHCSHGHAYDEQNTKWVKTPSGLGRQCRECCRVRQREYVSRRRLY